MRVLGHAVRVAEQVRSKARDCGLVSLRVLMPHNRPLWWSRARGTRPAQRHSWPLLPLEGVEFQDWATTHACLQNRTLLFSATWPSSWQDRSRKGIMGSVRGVKSGIVTTVCVLGPLEVPRYVASGPGEWLRRTQLMRVLHCCWRRLRIPPDDLVPGMC